MFFEGRWLKMSFLFLRITIFCSLEFLWTWRIFSSPLIWRWMEFSKLLCAERFPSGTVGRSYTLYLENGCEAIDAKGHVKLTIMKPLHAKWLSEFYNYINSSGGQEITRNGWLRAGITDAIKVGSSKLTSLDPFLDIEFVINENSSHVEFTCPKLVNPLASCPEDTDSESDSDWEEEYTHDDLKVLALHPFSCLQIDS